MIYPSELIMSSKLGIIKSKARAGIIDSFNGNSRIHWGNKCLFPLQLQFENGCFILQLETLLISVARKLREVIHRNNKPTNTDH